MNSSYCTQCGVLNTVDARFCKGCGRRFEEGSSGVGDYQAGDPWQDGGRPHVPNYLVQAILVTIFCCLRPGIVAIVYAAQINGKLAAGDIVGAQQASNNAKTWSWVSFGLGLAVLFVWGMFIGFGAG